ncbi:hypothetical protein FVF58_50065 [Paraburkholderia panacisoli]|uniref:Uncharacterized protein n=1 Tax=Paraburkholderia panacisoli TaxID=2603818 RepID=A0A5B0G1P3_9BURK|nr:hypothetical protein [Paraburkholderia panacisoli]KAA0997304.1 hypothetical protein FVF58_50065 [Paraburkholderia panacisoli]
MLEAALDSVHAALMSLAVQHDALFSLLLVAPAAVACFFAYFIVRYHVRVAPASMHGRTADTMCAAIPFMMFALGACWGVFLASVMAWWRTRLVAH